ncbi:MAG: flavodoxin domain-containing protein [Desulfobacterales bacterium]|nr:flavodoxin domain-containing protein [Desulfobacterales bacterium]
MQVKFITFSQTGNTRKVAKAMADALRGLGHEVHSVSFKKVGRNDFRGVDLVGLGAPCFESQAPTPMRQFLASLPSLVHTRAFVFATSGGAPGRVLQDLALPLKKKGAHVLGGFLCRGTCYHPVPCLEGRFPDRPNAGDLEKARRFARSVATLAAAGEMTSLPDENRVDLLRPGWSLYNEPSSAGLVISVQGKQPTEQSSHNRSKRSPSAPEEKMQGKTRNSITGSI